MWEIFSYMFMLRALLAGCFVAVLLGFLGSFIVIRKMSFLGEGIAHASLAGVAISLMFNWWPLVTAIFFAIFVAVVIYILERKVKISGDMAIGVVFTASMALGVMILHFSQGYKPELFSYLFGNILMISGLDLKIIGSLSFLIILILGITYHKILFVTLDYEGARLAGVNTVKYELLLYILTAIAVVLGTKLAGIVLVSALLITPPAISMLYTTSFKGFCFISTVTAILITILGLIGSFYLDLPTGATIVLVGAATLFLGYFIRQIFSPPRH